MTAGRHHRVPGSAAMLRTAIRHGVPSAVPEANTPPGAPGGGAFTVTVAGAGPCAANSRPAASTATTATAANPPATARRRARMDLPRRVTAMTGAGEISSEPNSACSRCRIACTSSGFTGHLLMPGRRCATGIGVLQFFAGAELGQRAGGLAAHGARRAAEQGPYLGVGHVLDVAEHDHGALARWQCGQRGQQG